MQVIGRLGRSLLSYVPGVSPEFVGGLPARDRHMTDSLVRGGADGQAVVSALVDAGVLVQRGEQVVLSTGFREQWRAEVEALREADDAAFSDAIAAAAADVERARIVDDGTKKFVLLRVAGEQLWLSLPVAIAETAALQALPGTIPEDERQAAARPLRLFLEECPDCGGRVDSAAADIWPGPVGPDGEADELLVCWDCGEQLYTF